MNPRWSSAPRQTVITLFCRSLYSRLSPVRIIPQLLYTHLHLHSILWTVEQTKPRILEKGMLFWVLESVVGIERVHNVDQLACVSVDISVYKATGSWNTEAFSVALPGSGLGAADCRGVSESWEILHWCLQLGHDTPFHVFFNSQFTVHHIFRRCVSKHAVWI